MVMELLGENLSELRRRQPNNKFSLLTTMKLAIQMIKSIEAVHDLGYLHRDIKPSNFAMGLNPPSKRKVLEIFFSPFKNQLSSLQKKRLASLLISDSLEDIYCLLEK